MELHHPIMSKLWDLGVRTKIKKRKNASINTILTLYLDTILEYVINNGGGVLCPPETNIDFLVDLPSILMSNIM